MPAPDEPCQRASNGRRRISVGSGESIGEDATPRPYLLPWTRAGRRQGGPNVFALHPRGLRLQDNLALGRVGWNRLLAARRRRFHRYRGARPQHQPGASEDANTCQGDRRSRTFAEYHGG